MPTIDLVIREHTHTVACGEGEEERLKYLADKFNKKIEELGAASSLIDDKTLYLIVALMLLDEAEEKRDDASVSREQTSDSEELMKLVNERVKKLKEMLNSVCHTNDEEKVL